MTPDEPPIPDDDALAGAARRALGRLAGDDVAVAPWEHVRAHARRAQRVRATIAVAAALLLVVAGAATVSATRGNSDHVGVAGPDHVGTTTTTTEAPTSTTAATTTTTAPPVAPPLTGATTPTVPIPEAQPGDLSGSITLASTTWVASQPALVSLTVQNVSGHPVAFPRSIDRLVGLHLDFHNTVLFASNAQAPLGPGEQRTFAGTITPGGELIGGTQLLQAGYLQDVVLYDGANLGDAFPGVPPVTITVIPPGWSPGDPLDPAQGSWEAALTADSTTVTSGGTVTFHVTVTNTGDQPQQTNAFGVLSLSCGGDSGEALPAATIAAGASQTFDLDYIVHRVRGPDPCSVEIAFPSEPGTFTADRVTSGVVVLTVTSPAATTTTGP
jgi:hypothetical protein